MPPQIRFGPWNRAGWKGLSVLVAALVVIASWWWWSGRPNTIIEAPDVITEGTVIGGIDAPMSGTVIVHVVGAVHEPGLVELPAGARVADAVEAAGGVKHPKALASVNLARPLIDGEQVALGVQTATDAGGASHLVSLNSATAAEFEALPGIGPVLAQRIVDWRTTNGPFRTIDDLGEVSGIGDSIMGQVRALVRP